MVLRVVGHIPHDPAHCGIRAHRAGSVELRTLIGESGVLRHQVEPEKEMCDRPDNKREGEARNPQEAEANES